MEFVPVKIYSLLSVRKVFSVYHSTFSNGYSYAGEKHNFWEFSYFISGRSGTTSGEKIFRCSEGDAVLHAPDVFHSFWVEEEMPCEIFTISFDGTGFENLLGSGCYILSDEEKYCVARMIKESEGLFNMQKTGDRMEIVSTASPDDVRLQIIKNQLELLCLSLVRRGKGAQGIPSGDPRSLCYAKIISFLRDNVDRMLTLEDISRGVYESPGKIKEIFRVYTGGGVMQYFNHLRCEHIMQQLRDGKSVKDLAAAMNFSSPYYLSYFFKRETGMTARDYLKSIEVKFDD